METFVEDKITINLRGDVFEVLTSLLQNIPESRLAKLNNESPEYNREKQEYYFNRNSTLFQTVLDFYESGELHIPKFICSGLAKRELEFWGISTTTLSKCCWKTFYEDIGTCEVYDSLQKHEDDNAYGQKWRNKENGGGSSKIAKLKRRIWFMLQFPNSSIEGRVYYMFVLVNVCVSIMTFGFSTMAAMRIPKESQYIFNVSWPKEYIEMYGNTTLEPTVRWLELISNTCIFLDLILWAICCPLPFRKYVNFLSIMEFAVIIFIYVVIYFEFNPVKVHFSDNMMEYLWIIDYIYIFRIMRILRLLYHIRGLKILHLCISANAAEIVFFIALFITSSCIFAALVYSMELYGDKPLHHFFHGVWWAVITLTSVGYGDTVPDTMQGRILGCTACICGTLIVAIPMVVIASSYGYVYDCYNTRKRHNESVYQKNKNKDIFISEGTILDEKCI